MFKDSHYAAVLGRALISIPFLLSGIGKIAAPAVTQGYIAAAGLPLPWVGYAIAVAVEVGGGLLLLLGIKTRLTAVALAIFTVATALAFHADFADQNQMIHFLKNLMITGGLLQVAAFGAGKFSVDARRGANGVAVHAGTPHAIAWFDCDFEPLLANGRISPYLSCLRSLPCPPLPFLHPIPSAKSFTEVAAMCTARSPD